MNSSAKHCAILRTALPILKQSALAVALFAAFPALAQTNTHAGRTDSAASGAGESSLVLGDVIVSGSGTGPLQTGKVLTSVDVLPQALIAGQQVAYSWQLLGMAPGVMLTEFRQGNTSGKFSFRAFNGEGEINAVKLLIDGIPSNSNDGNMPYLDMVMPLDIESIEVVRGTNDPRYGVHNIAGNANVRTRIGGNDTQARIGLGSFNTRDVQASKAVEADGLSQNYFFGYQKSDGYRDHAESEKMSFAGKWFFTPTGGDKRIGLTLRHYTSRAQEPGYLTLAESRANPRQSPAHNATDGGDRTLDQLAVHADWDIDSKLSWSNKAYANNIKDDRFVRFSAGVSQQERVVDERHYGLMSAMTWRPVVQGLKDFALEGGLDLQWQDNESLRYNTSSRTVVSQTRNQQFGFDVHGLWAQAVIRPTDNLKLVPGWRVDVVRGSYTNLLNGKTYGINDYGSVSQPKFSVVYSPDPRYSAYGNWGRTFQVGVGTASYKVNQTSDLAPSINDGWELGVKLNPADKLDGRIALWAQTASNEARRKLNDPANDSENIGKTRRRGVDVQFNLRPTDATRGWVGVSRQTSKILQAETSAPISQGKEIDHVPPYLITAGMEWQATPQLRLSVWGNAQGSYYLERTNTTAKFGDTRLLNVAANYRLSPTASVDVQVKNLTNRYYEYAWWDGAQTLHGPGDKRAVYTALNLKF